MTAQPDTNAAGMAQLIEMARALLNPRPDQEIVILAVDAEDAEALRDEYDGELEALSVEEVPDNVVPLFGGPDLPDEEVRQSARKESLERLLEIAERFERGELREFAMIAGIEFNENTLGDVTTMFTHGALEQMPLFLGGTELLKKHIMDVFDATIDDDELEHIQ